MIGKWITTDSIGQFYTNTESYAFKTDRIDSLELYGNRCHTDDSTGIVKCTIIDTYYDYSNNQKVTGKVIGIGNISQWFITNENKLHIIIKARADLRYVIHKLDDTSLELETYDGKGKLTLKKISSKTSNIGSAKREVANKDSSLYLVDGKKIDNVPHNTIYIRKGAKFVAK